MKVPSNKQIIYVTRDIERALGLALSETEGLSLDIQGYFIISNSTPFAKSVSKGHKNVLLIKERELLDTWELLKHPKVRRFISSTANPSLTLPEEGLKSPPLRGVSPSTRAQAEGGGVRRPNIMVFKNTIQIEKTCRENGWKLLNAPAELSNKVEEKISQIKWLGTLKKYLPPYKVDECKNFKFNDKSFVLQFNRSHTGSGTILISNEKQLMELKKIFPEREARIAPYIDGPLFTNNNVVGNTRILLGNISYQITGLKPFTDLPFSTIGNDWALPHKYLSKKQITQYKKIATDVGLKLKKSGWKGLFGIDVVVNEKTGKLYLLEINCRQPASTTYESQLQQFKDTKRQGYNVTTFEAHLMALTGIDLKGKELIQIEDGAQVILRNKKTKIQGYKNTRIQLFKKNQFNVIGYNNTEPNSDLLRIQSKVGIMKENNKFNNIGKKIIDIISNSSNN